VRRPARRLAALLAAAFLTALPAGAQPGDTCPPAGQGYHRLAATHAEVSYRWEPGELKVGQFFSADVIVCRAGAIITRVALDATMPAHGHGMNYLPKATEIAPGHYRFTGMMLHMPGRWRLAMDLIQGNRTVHRLFRDLDLKP
jgi:hypothetical protein